MSRRPVRKSTPAHGTRILALPPTDVAHSWAPTAAPDTANGIASYAAAPPAAAPPPTAAGGARGATADAALTADEFLEGLTLPLISALPSLDWAVDVLDDAIKTRSIVGLIGRPGLGKSVSMEKAAREFREREATLPLRERRQVFLAHAPRGPRAKPAHLLDVVYEQVVGERLQTHERGRTVAPHVLEGLVAAELRNANTAAVIIDHAEHLNDETFEAVVGLWQAVAQATSQLRGDELVAVGVGIVLVGTPVLGRRMQQHYEAGERLPRVRYVSHLPAVDIAALYRRLLPCFDAQARAHGDHAWIDFIERTVALRPISVRAATSHTRSYVRACVNEDPSINTVVRVPFDEDLFRQTWQDRLMDRDDPDEDDEQGRR